MKFKTLQLLLLFLVMGLFVSSKETAGKNKKACSFTSVQPKAKSNAKKEVKKKKGVMGYPYALAPGSYIFYY